MKALKDFIDEAFRINKDTKVKNEYNYHPKTKKELRELIEKLLDECGNDADLNDIDVSKITDMKGLFNDLDIHNIDISEWDVSNVTNMMGMFYKCENFNCDLSKWNVSKVTDMFGVFYKCENFDSDLSNWDVSKVTDMRNMFFKCNSLQNIPRWYENK